jgi:hypothetical protein
MLCKSNNNKIKNLGFKHTSDHLELDVLANLLHPLQVR